MKKDLLDFLKVNEVEYKENVETKHFSPIKIGGIADIVIYPDSEIKMISAFNFLSENKIYYKVIGKASNLLFPDNKISTVLIKSDKLRGFEILDDGVKFSTGESLLANSRKLASLGIGGISELCGIPGSIGGLVRNNAGAFGKEIGELVKFVTVYSPAERQIIRFTNRDISFAYRSSKLKSQDFVILSAELKLPYNLSTSDILGEIEEYKNLRRASQPTDKPSLGSVFKRPPCDFAARLIDESGLKGFSIGGAEVSKKHAGFIVNNGNATSNDFRALSNYVKQTVFARHGVQLEEEIEFL
jgi:UDP-N-acetylmuramate dehydrogenase